MYSAQADESNFAPAPSRFELPDLALLGALLIAAVIGSSQISLMVIDGSGSITAAWLGNAWTAVLRPGHRPGRLDSRGASGRPGRCADWSTCPPTSLSSSPMS